MTKQITEAALVSGSPEGVWRFITDSVHFQTWYAFGGAEIELRPGGAMALRWDEHGVFKAVVESVVHSKHFSFRWLSDPESLVEITLQLENKDMTRVQIVESGDLEAPEQSALAWRNGLKILESLAVAHRGK